jgi:uncharacterized protein
MASRSLRPVALITGPTSGLGAGFAERLARRGYDLVLVARDKQRLSDLAAELEQQFDAHSEIIAADLGTEEGRAAAVERLHKGVDFLVNNAGFGLSGEFWTADPAALQAQLDVNSTAVTQLTRAALPSMLGNAKGSIINVASVAGLVPGRGSTYSGTKSYVVAFTEGLSNGLVGTGVQIQALCPGFIHTEFHARAGIPMESMPEFMWLSVDQVVTASFEDLEKGKVISVPGWQYKIITSASKLVPRGLARRVTKVVGRGRGRT